MSLGVVIAAAVVAYALATAAYVLGAGWLYVVLTFVVAGVLATFAIAGALYLHSRLRSRRRSGTRNRKLSASDRERAAGSPDTAQGPR